MLTMIGEPCKMYNFVNTCYSIINTQIKLVLKQELHTIHQTVLRLCEVPTTWAICKGNG